MSKNIPACFQGKDGEDYIRRLEYQFDLDMGGYGFDPVPLDPPFENVVAVQIEVNGFEADYLGLVDMDPKLSSLSCPVYMFAPNSGHFKRTEWPESYPDGVGDKMVLVAEGVEWERDHECGCHGKFIEWTGAAGEPDKGIPLKKVLEYGEKYKPKEVVDSYIWDCTGNCSDEPHPECHRCDGDGYIDCTGGEWALYAYEEEEDDE